MAKGTDKVIAIKRKADAAAKAAKPKAAAPAMRPAEAAMLPAEAAMHVATPAKAKGKAHKAKGMTMEQAATLPAKPSRKPLEPAWLGWPKVEKHGLYFHRASDGQLVCFFKFAADYAAKKFMEAAANGEEMKLLPNGSVSFGRYIVSQVHDGLMQEIMDHRYTEAEAEWELPMPYNGYAAMLAGLPRPGTSVQADQAEAAGQAASAPAKAPPVASAPRAPRTASTGKSDPYTIKPDMPHDQKVRRMAKKMQVEATGKEDGWKALKLAAAKRVKDAGL